MVACVIGPRAKGRFVCRFKVNGGGGAPWGLTSGVRVGGRGAIPPFSYTKKGQRLPNPKYCDCGEVSDKESGRV